MRVSTRILLHWTRSRIGPLATLGDALALLDGVPKDAPIGARHRRKAREELVGLIWRLGEAAGIAEVLADS